MRLDHDTNPTEVNKVNLTHCVSLKPSQQMLKLCKSMPPVKLAFEHSNNNPYPIGSKRHAEVESQKVQTQKKRRQDVPKSKIQEYVRAEDVCRASIQQ